jgi:hypothetical protein
MRVVWLTADRWRKLKAKSRDFMSNDRWQSILISTTQGTDISRHYGKYLLTKHDKTEQGGASKLDSNGAGISLSCKNVT